jgi:predicted MFS family arabinose efflux permease
MGEVANAKLFDFAKLWHTLFDPSVGPTFMVTLVYFLAFSCAVIYGFQPFLIKVLHITPTQNSILFTIFGVIGLITQTYLVDFFNKVWGVKKGFSRSILLVAFAFLLMAVSRSLPLFIISMTVLGIFNSISQTLIPAILSREADEKSQGSIMGLNTSYQSLGMIVGPILGGVVATISIPTVFIVGASLVVVCYFLSFKMLKPGVHKESAF